MTTRDEIVADMLAECEDDHVGLWRLVNAVRDDLDLRDPSAIREATLQLVRQLLEHPGLEAGFPTPDGRKFIAWRGSSEETLMKIDKEWDALGRLPTIGDIVWFSQETPHASHKD